MTFEILLLLIMIGLALILLSFEWFPVDVTALGVLITLILTGLIPADRAFAGFGSDTVILILGLLIMTAALLHTGVVDMAGRLILRRAGTHPARLLLIVSASAATLSAFISNTAATAFFLPITIGVAARARTSPSRLLLPLAFASILSKLIFNAQVGDRKVSAEAELLAAVQASRATPPVDQGLDSRGPRRHSPPGMGANTQQPHLLEFLASYSSGISRRSTDLGFRN